MIELEKLPTRCGYIDWGDGSTTDPDDSEEEE